MMTSTLPLLLADAAAAQGPGLQQFVFPVLVMLGIVYFVMIRPQQAEAKRQGDMMSALKKGDDIVTTGGILGKVFAVDDKTVTIEVLSGAKLRVLKSAIANRGTASEEPAKVDAAKKEEK